MDDQKMIFLLRYRCHKEVSADKIEQIHPGRADGGGPGATLWLSEGHKVSVDEGWMSKHNPQEGGFFVVYDDGYRSFSPAKAFEDGYTRIGEGWVNEDPRKQ